MCDMKSDLFKAGTVPLKKIALKDLKKTGNKKATAKKQVKK
jgi:hypothetical protein